MTLEQKLRRLRGERTYAEIGRLAGCSPQNVRKLEAGTSEPGFRLGCRLARIFNVATDWLADDRAEWPSPPRTLEQAAVDAVREALAPFRQPGELSEGETLMLRELRQLYGESGPEGPPARAAVDLVRSTINTVRASIEEEMASVEREAQELADQMDRNDQNRGGAAAKAVRDSIERRRGRGQLPKEQVG